jgi:hypothetical protein
VGEVAQRRRLGARVPEPAEKSDRLLVRRERVLDAAQVLEVEPDVVQGARDRIVVAQAARELEAAPVPVQGVLVVARLGRRHADRAQHARHAVLVAQLLVQAQRRQVVRVRGLEAAHVVVREGHEPMDLGLAPARALAADVRERGLVVLERVPVLAQHLAAFAEEHAGLGGAGLVRCLVRELERAGRRLAGAVEVGREAQARLRDERRGGEGRVGHGRRLDSPGASVNAPAT